MTPILFSTFIALVFLGVPIAFVLGIASLAAMVLVGDYPLQVVLQRMFAAVDSFPLMAIPFFMLAGSLMEKGGITSRIIGFALSLVGGIRGSLAHVVSITGVIMGGISGSGVADTAAIGSIMVPEMTKRNYHKDFSAALVAAAGSIGLIIPPSIAMIIYGVSAGASIGDLFMSGFVPGILIAGGFMVYSHYIAIKRGYPVEGKKSWPERWVSFKDSIWALMMPVIIIVGIRFGVFTPTEGGVVAAVYAIIVGKFIYKELNWSDFPDIFGKAVISTATISFLIATASLFSWLLACEQIPQQITQSILSLSDNKLVILAMINVLLLIVGMFLDSGPAIILLVPVLVPVAQSLDVNLVQFGLMMVINLTIGLLTPPVGTALYVSSNISKVPLVTLSRAILPFIGIMLLVLMLITYVPEMTTWVIGK
ncbi:putative TRAP transporter large permease protein HI_0050 [uncultured Sporomusa sp.]|uniref:Putative TRAP transporter large permease protein HI_0050 n=1 Tax=uncultured Sporomusa sp. TaxID=307249 RepID=A0A212LW12_9FIRM|nr:TRAP transporter large permease [uncultured Sporomusa sp.]SCM81691.1 putative TRAP transporter large permease protein HI_0050 [uncultured Sporomusa sp.]